MAIVICPVFGKLNIPIDFFLSNILITVNGEDVFDKIFFEISLKKHNEGGRVDLLPFESIGIKRKLQIGKIEE